MDQFTIEWLPETRAGVRTLQLAGPFTLTEVIDFQSVIRESTFPMTIVDLSGVAYMDSAALGSLLGFHVSCQRESRKYALAGVSDRLKTMMRVAGVDGLLPVYATAADAEAALTA